LSLRTRTEGRLKLILAVAGLVVVFVAASVKVGYWWSNTQPRRPSEVSPDAVFLWAPYVGAPAPRRGRWLACWSVRSTEVDCRLNDIDGALKYEGAFTSYDRKPVLPSELSIDTQKTRDLGVWIDHTDVPLVFLSNGRVLIPAAEYQQGVRALQQRQMTPK
jgi:hypothetical protein